MKNILFILCFVTSGTSWAANIDGMYVVESLPGCQTQASESDPIVDDYSYNSVSIERSSDRKTVLIRLSRGSNPLPDQSYICDSKEHAGDGNNTGDTYIADCQENSMQIRRIFKQLKFPLIVNYSRSSDNLKMVETFDGSPFKRQCNFIPNSKRYFMCEAEDRIGRKSLLRVFADSKVVEWKDASNPQAQWNRLYDDTKACALSSSKSRCENRLIHNLGDPNQLYDAAYGSVRCENSSGKPLPELNANFEINRSGDGSGVFICGKLPRTDLVLSKCKSVK